MYYYTELVRREPNRKGRPRLVTLLGHLPGAVGMGFTGTGTDTRQGEKDGQRRVWRFDEPLTKLPHGVIEISVDEYETIDTEREATKPPPPPEPAPLQDLRGEISDLKARLSSLEGK